VWILLVQIGLPVWIPEIDFNDLLELMTADKKAVAGKVKFVLANKIGSVDYNLAVPDEIVIKAFNEMQR
jgi:3-dehydroquinate synthetase